MRLRPISITLRRDVINFARPLRSDSFMTYLAENERFVRGVHTAPLPGRGGWGNNGRNPDCER